MYNKKIISILFITLLSLNVFSQDFTYNGPKAKYVFFFIGDGMGLSQVNSAENYLTELNGEIKDPIKLTMSKFKTQGICTTQSLESFITDSAAAATALATGYKTVSGVVALDRTRKIKRKSIAKYAKESGMKVGIISSVYLDHGTPAAFYANQRSRNDYDQIATQLADSGFDFFGGGFIRGRKAEGFDGNIFQYLEHKGYTLIKGREKFESWNDKNSKVFMFDKKLNADALLYTLDTKNDDTTLRLTDFTEKAIELLDNDNGFFIMIEGGKIDWASHANDGMSVIDDVIAMDNAVKSALNFANKHPNETLIVVTADHETGGMTVGFSGTKYKTYMDKLANQKTSYELFNQEFAKYKMALQKKIKKRFNKVEYPSVYELSELIEEHFGLILPDPERVKAIREARMQGDKKAREQIAMVITNNDAIQLQMALEKSLGKRAEPGEDPYSLYGDYEPFTVKLVHLLNNNSGVGWTTFSHTGIPVPVYAHGVGAELFGGMQDNTDIPKKMMKIMKIK